MGLLTWVVSLPFAPVRGVIWVSELIQDEVEQQLHDPKNLRRELEEIDRAVATGELSPDEAEQVQQEVLDRMTGPEKGVATDRKE
ncbi:gas vesicle protein GvpG [Nocardia stercoris]|uniref:Gas vesicle protein G n=1 Tax=Nocardia stercoris TaxID=2483361 RepID=A0A3M2KV23_9NOCA|nr:gas vesicle protein GvpG [Nocardia stercoris]RMI29001.1 gas vesicle protein G [Nocardia stercoris]